MIPESELEEQLNCFIGKLSGCGHASVISHVSIISQPEDTSVGIATVPVNPPYDPDILPGPDKMSGSTNALTRQRHGAFYTFPRAEELAVFIKNLQTRSYLASSIKRSGSQDIWNLFLTLMDNGLLISTSEVFAKPTLRTLFPKLNHRTRLRYDLTKTDDLIAVRDRILPIAIAAKERIIAHPATTESIIIDGLRKQTDIRMYEERKKPLQINDRWMVPGENIKTRMNCIRLSILHLDQFARDHLKERARMENVFGLIRTISRCAERQPNGECEFAATPKTVY